ncbi:MAG: polymer-forming cytoskeletal protein [Candidatus Heimdallarchaeota archaeon]|nr:MAG: polymer-forming cytoskeletal protein [Candidatus Heimdallarchaeota archaeon]
MSNREIEDLKVLIRSLDIRLKNEEISQEEYDNLKTKYEAQLNEEINLAKEKSFLRNLSYISISGSGKVTDSHIKISGSGRIDGWRGGSISISGSGKISDDEIKVSGSASLPGGLETHTLKASGSIKADGPLETTIFASSGSCQIDGYLVAHEKLTISGSGKIEADIKGGHVASSGSLKVAGAILCVSAELNGSYKIKGNVECQESFSSELNSKCTIGGDLLCSGDVRIEQGSGRGRLQVEQILAKGDVYLEGVNANYVSGKTVKLGPDCEVEKVEEKG